MNTVPIASVELVPTASDVDAEFFLFVGATTGPALIQPVRAETAACYRRPLRESRPAAALARLQVRSPRCTFGRALS